MGTARWASSSLGLLCLARLAACQYADMADTNYYDQYELYTAGYHYDLYNDENDQGMYLNQYSGEYDDVYQDYYFNDVESEQADCRISDTGAPKFNGSLPACDLKLDGADAALTGLLGGLDGVYAVSSCESGLPLYKRKDSKATEARVLWYSNEYRDWDISNGSNPSTDVLVYGGDGGREVRPNFVAADWKVAAEFVKDYKGTDAYAPVKFTLSCADGTKVEKPTGRAFGSVPVFTDDEAQAQYSRVINKARSKNASAEVNLGLVTILVMVGLGVVFGLPYMVARNRRRRRSGDQGGLASILDFTRKRGHTS